MKNVVVTGCTRGIGRQIATHLAKEGYCVIGIYRASVSEAKTLEKDFGITTYQCDLSCALQTKQVAENILKDFTNIYAVVNNAGVSLSGLFTDITTEEFDKVFDTNVKGTMILTQTLLPNMIKNKQGRVVNISSIWGVCGASCEVVYSASKSAIIGFTKALSKEVGPSGITVNAVAPGVIETDMLSSYSQNDLDALAQETSLQRLGKPDDVSGVVSFFLSEKSDFVTGQVLTVDGGLI